MDGTIKKTTTGTIETAILLTTSGVFDIGDGDVRNGHPSPLTRVAGLSLFQRAVLTLQRAGISQIFVLAGEEQTALQSLVQHDDRIAVGLRWLPIREFPPGDPQTWESLASDIKGSCLILGTQIVFSRSLIEQLRDEGRDGRAVVVVGSQDGPCETGNPRVLVRQVAGTVDSQAILFQEQADLAPNPELPVAADVVVVPARFLGVTGILQRRRVGPIRLALEQASVEGQVGAVLAARHWYRDARGPNGPRLAERTLLHSLRSLKGGLDGLIDRHLNRRLSPPLTRLFLHVGLSPNAVTLVSMAIGLIAAGSFAFGRYDLAVMGALLFQLSVIVDCCDGEVARLTFAESPSGQRLDLMADNVVHMAIFSAVAWGQYLQGPWQDSVLPLVLGGSAVMGNGLSFWAVSRAQEIKVQLRENGRRKPSAISRLDTLLGKVVNRDFSVVLLLFSLLNGLAWFLLLAAVGSILFGLTMAWTLWRALRARA